MEFIYIVILSAAAMTKPASWVEPGTLEAACEIVAQHPEAILFRSMAAGVAECFSDDSHPERRTCRVAWQGLEPVECRKTESWFAVPKKSAREAGR